MIIIGHRGAKGLAPENTLAAIKKGLRHHVDELELDVRVTQDLVPVLHHDPFVLLDSKKVPITMCSLDELWAANPVIPTLAEALVAVHGAAIAHLEIKPGEPIEPIAEVIRECLTSGNYALDSFLLASKSQKTLREVRRELPELQTVVIESWSGVRARRRADELGTKRISMRATWLWTGFLRAVHHAGYQLTPYTMNDPRKVAKWQPYLYGIITDYPDRFKK